MTATLDPRVIKPGESAYLVARTKTASADCWRNPQVTVISGPENGVFMVALPDGREIRVHEDDVVRRRPDRQVRDWAPRPRPSLDGAEEVPLW
jgi:hypothetical protein